METLDRMPSTLYKYRSWSDKFHKRLLTDNELYFASADQFNDPFDAALPYQYKEEDMTDDNIFLKLIEIEKKASPHKSDMQIHEIAYKRQSSGIFKSGRYWEEFYPELKEIVNRTFGICSLSTEKDNILMWSHYSDCHKGFTVGLDTAIVFHTAKGQLMEVIYNMEFPKVGLFDSGVSDVIRLLYTKSPVWQYEGEYRLTIDRPRTTVMLPTSAFKEVVLGCKMPDREKNEVTRLVKDKFKNTKLYEAIISLREFKLDLIPII